MLSRGKQLVAMALNKKDLNTHDRINISENRGFELVASKLNGSDENNNTDELTDLDDVVQDPDYLPPKKKRKHHTNILQSLVCNESLSSDSDSDDFFEHQDNNGSTNSDSTDDCTIPLKVMNPKELFFETPDLDNRQANESIHSTCRETRTVEISQINNMNTKSSYSETPNVDSAQTANETLESAPNETPNTIHDVDHIEEVNTLERHETVTESDRHVESDNTDSKILNLVVNASKRKKNEVLRMTGLQYAGRKRDNDGKMRYIQEKSERILTETQCSKRCRKRAGGRRCLDIDENSRKAIIKQFWRTMDWKEKRVYVMSLVDKHDVAQRTTSRQDSRRKYSYVYHLKVNGERLMVCKEMFLSTLGLNEKMVYNWILSDTPEQRTGIPKKQSAVVSPQPSKAREPRHKDTDKNAREYLESLPKVPSHYCRADSKKHYIEPVFGSIAQLHDEYTRKMEEELKPAYGYQKFKNLFNELNLGLYKPKKDLCDTCCGHDAGTVDDSEYSEHIKRKDEARASKAADKRQAITDGNMKVITVDLQSLLVCPKLNASALYYKMKLSCHNYTVYDLVTHAALCYFWHECDGELTSNVFTSCLIDYLTNLDLNGIETIIIYSDGCGYQNRNITLSNALRKFAMDNKVTIEQKYLERGHTQMECDSVHSVIEQSIKKNVPNVKERQPAIFIPQHYVDAIVSARSSPGPYQVKYLDFTFFKDYGNLGGYTSIRPGIGVGSSTVSDIRLLKYTIEGTILYKTGYSDNYEPLPESRTRAKDDRNRDIISLYRHNLPLKPSKYQHLQQLKNVIPKDYHSFYDGLPVSKH